MSLPAPALLYSLMFGAGFASGLDYDISTMDCGCAVAISVDNQLCAIMACVTQYKRSAANRSITRQGYHQRLRHRLAAAVGVDAVSATAVTSYNTVNPRHRHLPDEISSRSAASPLSPVITKVSVTCI